MDLGIRGKTAWIGGASRGLGLAVCERLGAEGANLVMVSRGGDDLNHASDRLARMFGVQTLPIPCDQSQQEDIQIALKKALQRFETIDILVHNTGGPPPGLFADHKESAWVSAFDSLLLSVVRLFHGVLPGMQKSGWGRVVVNTSFTVKEPAPRLILSNVFRTAVVALAKTVSREVASHGVTVNCVCPGAFDTNRMRAVLEEQAHTSGQTLKEAQQSWESRIPIGRLLRPHELADLVAFLVSDLAGAITGASIPIEGGMLHGLF